MEKYEKLGLLIDKIDNLAHAVQIDVPAHLHVDSLKTILPEVTEELKQEFINITGENPWK